MAKSDPAERKPGFLARHLPAMTVTFSDVHGVRQHRFSPLGRLILGGVILSAVAWTTIATTTFLLNGYDESAPISEAQALRTAYEARLAELMAERDDLRAQLSARASRLTEAEDSLLRQQQEIMSLSAAVSEQGQRVSVLRNQLGGLQTARDMADSEARVLSQKLAVLQLVLNEGLDGDAEVSSTIDTIATALAETAARRDEYAAEAVELTNRISQIELEQELSRQRQDRMLSQLENAIQLTLVPLENVLKRIGLDVDQLLESVQRNYSGTGGLSSEFVSAAPDGTGSDPVAQRISVILDQLDRVAMLNIAVSRTPLGMPVLGSYRHTSSFGMRGGRMHKGTDLAGATGTAIVAAADGVVFFAGRQSGFGNLVKVRHDFGYVTYYAHLNSISVTRGQRVARGERLGGMGTTGRSTGVHLHYEIHLNGEAIDPMTYIRVGRDVF
ncbi:MAG: DUF5930 domain-containing protein [Paracoccaceae bacterium]